MIIDYILIFIFQIVFNVFKTLEIKYTYEDKLKELLINSVWINLTSLCTAYYSLENLFNHNYAVIPVYIAGSIIGKWLSMRGFDKIIKKGNHNVWFPFLYLLISLKIHLHLFYPWIGLIHSGTGMVIMDHFDWKSHSMKSLGVFPSSS